MHMEHLSFLVCHPEGIHGATRNELIKLPVQVKMKCKAMMGICIYWIRRHISLDFQKNVDFRAHFT